MQRFVNLLSLSTLMAVVLIHRCQFLVSIRLYRGMKMNTSVGKQSRLLLLAVATLLFSGCIVAPPPHRHYVGAVVTVAPPPLRVEVRGEPPYPGYLWFDGYWGWEHDHHVWVPGHWVEPRAGYRWAPHRWVHERDGWHLEEGHWERGRR
jgi:hypothetical protein